MILGFKEHFPWGEPTFFKEKVLGKWEKLGSCKPLQQIQLGTKLHTIREGNRWKAGMLLHMATGVRTKKYDQFNKDIDALSTVKAVQFIGIMPGKKEVWLKEWVPLAEVWQCYQLSKEQLDQLAFNDGFTDQEQFWKFFVKPLDGQLIHWTDLNYKYESIFRTDKPS